MMEPTLDEALYTSLFGAHQPQTASAGSQPATPSATSDVLEFPTDLTQARAQFDDVQKAAGMETGKNLAMQWIN